jgi:hypothetical protein
VRFSCIAIAFLCYGSRHYSLGSGTELVAGLADEVVNAKLPHLFDGQTLALAQFFQPPYVVPGHESRSVTENQSRSILVAYDNAASG